MSITEKTGTWMRVTCLGLWLGALLLTGQSVWAEDLPETPETPEVPEAPELPGDPADPVDPPELPDEPSVDPVRVSGLAEQYGVEAAQVEAMRVDGMGWGEMEIALALSSRVAADLENPGEGALAETLNSILQARAEGRGWGGIASDYNLKVGDVVSSAKSGKPPRERAGTELAPAKVDKRMARVNRPGRTGKVERPNRPEKPQRPDKVERPQRPEKVSRPQKPTRPEKPSKPEKPEKPGRGVGR